MEKVSSSAVERQAWACSNAQGKRSDAGPWPAILNFLTCSLSHASHSPSQSSSYCFFLTTGSFSYRDAPSPPPYILGSSLLPTPCATAFYNLARAVRPEKSSGGVIGVGKLLSGLKHSKNNYHLLSTSYVLYTLHSQPHLFFTTILWVIVIL